MLWRRKRRGLGARALVQQTFYDLKKTMATIKTIFWDNDGVLVETEHLYFQATQRVLASVGIELNLQSYREMYLTQSQGTWHLATRNGVSQSEIDRLRAERDILYGQLLQEEAFAVEGAEQVLQTLASRFTMGVVTSSRRDHFDIMHRATNFTRFFDFVLTREDYDQSKPHPEPYLKALEIVGHFREECLVIEDSERGLTAAKSAGLACWIIPNELTRCGNFSLADRVIGQISDVPALLEKLSNKTNYI